MTKKHFIALADAIKEANKEQVEGSPLVFELESLDALADFCQSQNPSFNRDRWFDYIAGRCGPNGGVRKN
jgi:hypothetical protein